MRQWFTLCPLTPLWEVGEGWERVSTNENDKNKRSDRRAENDKKTPKNITKPLPHRGEGNSWKSVLLNGIRTFGLWRFSRQRKPRETTMGGSRGKK